MVGEMVRARPSGPSTLSIKEKAGSHEKIESVTKRIHNTLFINVSS
jgi:hypothetical protein